MPSMMPWIRSSRIFAKRYGGNAGASGSDPLPDTPRLRDFALLLSLVALAIVLLPKAAYAWTPGTHVFLGEAVMRSLSLVPTAVADLLRAFPYDFLYGSIAADTSMAKKYAPVGRHCHSWNVGWEILDQAGDEPLKAFATGYLAHLAADAIAHNYFVPKQLTVTSSTSAVGHSYWESRFETHLGERYSGRARELILLDHTRSDALLDRVLSPTIFSTTTNRRLFRGMVYVADTEGWQRIFQLMMEKSRWDLTDDEVALYLERSFDFILDLLWRMDGSEPYSLDPSGDYRLKLAKQVRRQVLRTGGDDALREEADRHFGLPDAHNCYVEQLDVPLYFPNRSVSI